jgi:hypothetical protein
LKGHKKGDLWKHIKWMMVSERTQEERSLGCEKKLVQTLGRIFDS